MIPDCVGAGFTLRLREPLRRIERLRESSRRMLCSYVGMGFMATALLAFNAMAEETDASLLQQLNLNGSARAGYYGKSRNLDDQKDVGTGALWLKAAPKLGDNASMQLEGWLRNDHSFKGKGEAKLREGYLNYTAGDADFRIGKQIIVWGRADGINPTDNLTPRNYTLLTPETDDQRLGALAAKAKYTLPELAITAIWLPRFGPSVYPLPAQPGVVYSEAMPQGGQGALKLDHSGGEVDWSASYFNGYDLNPDLKIGAVTATSTHLILQHRRIRVLGMDGATTLGRYGLRAEAAYTWTDNPYNDPLVKHPFIYVVLGGDRTFSDNFNINLQYYFRRVASYQDPQAIANPMLRAVATQAAITSSQLTRFQHGLTTRISDKWLNETLEGEIAVIYDMTLRDYALRPKFIYAFTDQMKGTLGADVYRGGSNTFFGRLRNNSSLFAEMKYSF